MGNGELFLLPETDVSYGAAISTPSEVHTGPFDSSKAKGSGYGMRADYLDGNLLSQL
jgi:hypothetical protein